MELVRQVMEVNVLALMDLTQRASRHMRERGTGQIVEVSSVLGFVGLPYSAAYAASKHAVNGLVKSLRYELKGTGVRVWAFCPNRTESEFHGVALGGRETGKRAPYAEPVDRVVRQLVRGLDGRRGFVLPGISAWGVVLLARLLPGPFDWFMGRWAPGHFRKEMEGE
jgi:short-subunit dehydrogenase